MALMPRAARAACSGVPKVSASIASSVWRRRRTRSLGPARNELCSATPAATSGWPNRSEEHTSELQSLAYLVCRLLLEKKKNRIYIHHRSIDHNSRSAALIAVFLCHPASHNYPGPIHRSPPHVFCLLSPLLVLATYPP